MICYLDRTFCNRGEGCTCPEWRRYTPEIQAAADRWFGKPGAPVAMGALCIEPATPERAKEEQEAMTTWTKEPPKEPGYWWCRRCGCSPFVVEIVMYLMDLVAVRSEYSFGACGSIDLERFDDHEWWPIPIQPPPTEQEKP